MIIFAGAFTIFVLLVLSGVRATTAVVRLIEKMKIDMELTQMVELDPAKPP